MSHPLTNERGVALIITLLIVALLTITVIEFTYSVEVDEHMAHNALASLQASLLARSGINLGEAFLLHDSDMTVDAFTEDWCPHPGPAAQSCQIDESNSQLVLPDNMRLRVEIVDEGGKLNLNNTRPPNVNLWRYTQTNPKAPMQVFQSWNNALGMLLESRGADPQITEGVTDYWNRLYELVYQNPSGGLPGQAAAQPTPSNDPLNPQLVWELPSLDDASIIPGFTPSVIQHIRSVVTALPSRQARVNANTAPHDVLAAITGDSGIADDIISQREQAPMKLSDLTQLLARGNQSDPAFRNARIMLGVTSNYYLIRASAIINPNPTTGLGGVSRSASMLVQRAPKPGVPYNAPAGTPRWTLTQLDWQKEPGAELFVKNANQESGTNAAPTPSGG